MGWLITPARLLSNGPLANGNIINYTASNVRAVEISIGISYSDDIAKGKAAMEAVLKADPRVSQDEANVVAVVDLGTSSVDFLVRVSLKSMIIGRYFLTSTPPLKLLLKKQA